VPNSATRDAVAINAAQVSVTVELSSRYAASRTIEVMHTDLGHSSTAASLLDVNLPMEGVAMQHRSLLLRLRLRLHPLLLPLLYRPQAQSRLPQAHLLSRHFPPARSFHRQMGNAET
jgi:hypothetical protein